MTLKINSLVLVASCCLMLSGCDKTPSCSDKEVVNLLKEISRDYYKGGFEELKDPIKKFVVINLQDKFTKLSGMPEATITLMGLDKKAIDRKLTLSNFLLSVVEKEEESEKNIIDATNLNKWDVNTITPKSKDPNVLMCSCSANLVWKTPVGNLEQQIEYTAQNTEDTDEIKVVIEELTGILDL